MQRAPRLRYFMKRGFDIFKSVSRLYFLHISAILAVWLAMYFPGLDIILAMLYLLLLWGEGKYTYRTLRSRQRQALIASIWQLPGLILAASVILGLDRLTDFAYYFVFILELWFTPVLPLISVLPTWTILERPVYYYALFVMVPIMAIYYYLPSHRTIPGNS